MSTVRDNNYVLAPKNGNKSHACYMKTYIIFVFKLKNSPFGAFINIILIVISV